MNLASPRIAWVAVLVSLLLRAIYFSQIHHNPFFDSPVMDEGYHDAWAKEIAAGEPASKIPFFRAPLYPFFLGGLYSLFGPNYTLIRAIQLAIGSLTPLLSFALARRLKPRSPWIPALAAFATALDGMLFYYEADLLLESILAPLSMLFLLLLVRAGQIGRNRDWLWAGISLGAVAITRPNILLFSPVAFLLALGWKGERFSLRPPRLGAAALVTAGAVALVLPVTAANLVQGKDRVLIAWQGGLNFFLGNNEEANGWSATAPRIMRTDWWGGYEDSIRLAEEARGRKLKPSEVSDYWMERATDWWKKNPKDGIVLTIRKADYFLSGEEFSNNRNLDLFIRDYAPLILPARFLLYVATPLACVGALAIFRRNIASRVVLAYLAVYAITVVMFFVTARYRVPIRPLLLLLAVEGVFFIAEVARRSRLQAFLWSAGTVASAVLINSNAWVRSYEAPPAQFYQSIATIYHERGEAASALRFQEKTVQIDPAYPDGNLNLGTMYMEAGNVPGAIHFFERERSLDPKDGRNLVSLAQAYARAERFDDAEQTYSAAESAGFRDAAALYNHGILLERLQRPADAESLYRSAVSVDSSFADAWNNLGVLEARAGRLESAVELWERALRAHPGDPKILDNIRKAKARLSGSSPPQGE